MTNDPYEDLLLKLMVYGTPGCGKTTFIGTAQDVKELWPALYLNAKGNPSVLRKNKQRPDVYEITKVSDFNDPYKWLIEGQKPDDKFAQDNSLGQDGEYKLLVVDAITEVQRHVVRRVAGGESIKPGDLMPKLDRQGFGQLLGTMLNWANAFVELPMHIILVSHEAEKEGRVSPLLWGQSGLEICSQVKLVMRLVTKLAFSASMKAEIKNVDYNAGQILETYPVYAKEQYGINQKYIVDPTLQKVMDLIEQGS